MGTKYLPSSGEGSERRSDLAYQGRHPRVEWRHFPGIGPWPRGFHDPAEDCRYGPPIVPTVPPLACDEVQPRVTARGDYRWTRYIRAGLREWDL